MKKYDNYKKHLETLMKAPQEDLNNEFIISGIIDKFFIQFELGWKVLKELLAYEGRSVASSGSPREIIKAAYECYDFIDEKIWLAMLRERNDMAHIYDGEAAKLLVEKIIAEYIPEFVKLKTSLMDYYGDILQ